MRPIKLATLKSSLADPKYTAASSVLADLFGKLSRRVDLVNAALDTVELGSEAHAVRIQSARANVEQTTQAAEQYLNGIPNGKAWLPYLRLQSVKQTVKTGDLATAVVALPDDMHADRAALVHRLDDVRAGQRVGIFQRGDRHRAATRHRQPGAGEHRLGRDLVHRQRRGADA